MKSYNEAQKAAIMHKEGPMLVLAGPGSGKTTVITGRTQYLIKKGKVAPSSILVVTFTKAAAVQIKERFLHMSGENHTMVTFGTFHGVFYGILKQAYGLSGSNILGEEEKEKLLREHIYGHGLEIEDERDFLDNISREISLVKNSQIPLEHYYATSCSEDVFRSIYTAYVKKCRSIRKLDFDDMLLYCYELFKKRPDILSAWQKKFQYILIDEFQDINTIQYEIIKMLALPENNLFIVGDDDQSIYHFRGAKPEIMLHFPKEFPDGKILRLDTNYRCTQQIVTMAEKLVGHNKYRYKKEIKAAGQAGKPVEILEFENVREECLYVLKKIQEHISQGEQYEQIAILFRTNIGARSCVEKLIEYNLPFQMRDVIPNIYNHWIARDLFAYFRMAMGQRSRKDFLQIMNRPNRYISRDALGSNVMSFEDLYCFYEEKKWMCERIEEWESDLRAIKRMSPFAGINYIRKAVGYDDYLKEYADYRRLKAEDLLEVLEEIHQSAKAFDTFDQWMTYIEQYCETIKDKSRENEKNKHGIVISTLHSVKGLEYNRVYILDVNEGNIPYHKAVLDSDLEEERRMLYVGMTRAKEELHLYYVKKKYEKEQERSRFLAELQDKTNDNGKV